MSDKDYKHILAYHLRIARMVNGMSQQDVATKINRTTNAISNWELGNTTPSADDFMKLCKIYDFTPNQLYGVENAEAMDQFVKMRQDYMTALKDLEEKKEAIMKEQEAIRKRMNEFFPETRDKRKNRKH